MYFFIFIFLLMYSCSTSFWLLYCCKTGKNSNGKEKDPSYAKFGLSCLQPNLMEDTRNITSSCLNGSNIFYFGGVFWTFVFVSAVCCLEFPHSFMPHSRKPHHKPFLRVNTKDVLENVWTTWSGLLPQLLFTHVHHSRRVSAEDAFSQRVIQERVCSGASISSGQKAEDDAKKDVVKIAVFTTKR